MGEVYRARDEHLERDVAIKVLPPGMLANDAARKRFRQEALALSKLNHPNIATVHDFVSEPQADFLVMECVPGTTLSDKLGAGPLAEKDILALGAQLAEGLAAAHEQGIIHCDLKPGNLHITPDGRLKILDFGLARFLGPTGDSIPTQTESQIRDAAGTLPYMAPEQLSGSPPDTRSDLYAAGVVLYEMATGQRLFPYEREAHRQLAAILHQAPRAPTALNPRVSAGLEGVILKCLEKDPEHRYQSAREILADLRRLGVSTSLINVTAAGTARRSRHALFLWLCAAAAALALAGGGWLLRMRAGAGEIHSLAVLPLRNLSGDPEQDYFADGMTEALITDLGKISALRVVSRTSVMQYKNSARPLNQIAKDLNLDAAVEGSVLRSGSRVQITVRLVQARTDTQMWSQSYERDLRDALALESEVARRVADQIRVKLTPEENARFAGAGPINPQALDAYLKGRQFWEQRSPEDLKQSLDYFQKAIALEPNYALAYVGIADTYAVMGNNQFLRPVEAFPKAEAAALKAREIDERLAEAHASLGFVLWNYDLDWEAAGSEFRRAIELNPNYATAYHWYAGYLACLGRHDEAIAAIRTAQERDPLSSRIAANIGFILFLARRYDAALEGLDRAQELNPQSRTVELYRAMTYTQQGKHQEALAELQKYAEQGGERVLNDLELAYGLAMAGQREKARASLDDALSQASKSYVPPYATARVFAALGDRRSAFSYLNKAFDERAPQVAFLRVDPRLDPLRSEPGFQELLRRARLAE